jgi:hypothetical protein
MILPSGARLHATVESSGRETLMEGGCGRRQDTNGMLVMNVAVIHTSKVCCVISNKNKTNFMKTTCSKTLITYIIVSVPAPNVLNSTALVS